MAKKAFNFRTGLWHLRQGGIEQYKDWRGRLRPQSTSQPTQEEKADNKKTEKRKSLPNLPSVQPITRTKSFPSITAGVILDDFSLAAWSPEFNTVLLSRENWRDDIRDYRLDFLFVESAWAGNHGSWTYQMTGGSAPKEELRELVAYCHEKNIPTIFWNKEDPVHFDDFIETAKIFDVVFTTDSQLIPRYREVLGHENIFVMSFAAQPSLHNPVRKLKSISKRGIAFGGMYFSHKYPERREQMDILLNGAIGASIRTREEFHIFSRHYGGNEKYQFPAPFDQFVVGALPYDKMLAAYQHYKVFLNVNSVTDSPTMCARRVFEILACGTPVLSGDSQAVRNFFPENEVPIVTSQEVATQSLRFLLASGQLRDRMVHKAQRRIWENHTYAHRAQQIIDTLGIQAKSPFLEKPRVSVVTSTNRPDFVENVMESVARQTYPDIEFILLTHGFEADEAELATLAASKGIDRFRVLGAPSDKPLGSCLNKLVENSTGEIIAKFDDDDYYGENYLLDSVHALKFSNADLVGKRSLYMYVEEDDVIVLRNPHQEHKMTNFVAGATLVGKRRVFEENPFQNVHRGEDSRFLKAASESGAKIYSADRFNFLQFRGGHAHTWNVHNTSLYAEGTAETFGLNLKHVTV